MNQQRVMLRYLGTPYHYEAQSFIDATWRPDWFSCVFACPVIEMLGKTPREIAEELVRMVGTTEWVKQHKRPIRHGDLFTLDEAEWVFIPSKDIPTFTAASTPTFKLTDWPHTAIAQVKAM